MLNNVAIAALYAVQKLNKRVLIVDIDIHLSGGTSDCVRGVDTILLVDVFGARGQELRARARAEGRNWRVKETFDNTIALNVSLLHSQAGDQVYESAQVCGEICAAATAHKPGVCFFFLNTYCMHAYHTPCSTRVRKCVGRLICALYNLGVFFSIQRQTPTLRTSTRLYFHTIPPRSSRVRQCVVRIMPLLLQTSQCESFSSI